MCFFFDTQRTEWTSSVDSIRLTSGIGSGEDDADPIPVYQRGLWFGGS
jgi:hypothetical protein